MLVMVLMKGVDYCSRWAGPENLEKFGLVLQDPDLEAMWMGIRNGLYASMINHLTNDHIPKLTPFNHLLREESSWHFFLF